MNDFYELINRNRPTLVDFFATWCGPCKMQAPILEDLKSHIGETATIIKIDIDNNRELAEQYHVQSVPTLILFKSGHIVWRSAGVHPADMLEDKIKEHLD